MQTKAQALERADHHDRQSSLRYWALCASLEKRLQHLFTLTYDGIRSRYYTADLDSPHGGILLVAWDADTGQRTQYDVHYLEEYRSDLRRQAINGCKASARWLEKYARVPVPPPTRYQSELGEVDLSDGPREKRP